MIDAGAVCALLAPVERRGEFVAGVDPGAVVLIELAAAARPARLRRAMCSAGVVVDEDRADRVHAHLCGLAVEYATEGQWAVASRWRSSVAVEAVQVLRPHATVLAGAGLHVGEGLTALPASLLEVAAQIAERQRNGVLHVNRAPLMPVALGLFTASDVGGLVLLDEHLDGDELGRVFGHELGHAADPRPGERSRFESECFAEQLGRRLVETLDVAASIDDVASRVPASGGPGASGARVLAEALRVAGV